MSATELLVWGVVIHLIVDWLGQNQWIALHKTSLRHPAGYIHAAVHALALWIVFPIGAAAALGLAHLLIDTRRPLELWGRVMSQPSDGPEAFTIHVWRDQTLHVAVIAATALLAAG
jgi:hypothetical protein